MHYYIKAKTVQAAADHQLKPSMVAPRNPLWFQNLIYWKNLSGYLIESRPTQ